MKDLKIICSKIIPLKGFSSMNVFGVIFRRYELCGIELSKRSINHEGIHTCQSEDFIPNKKNNNFIRILDYLIFYILYIIEWIFKIICNIFYWKIRAYKSLSFEQEAYTNELNFDYQETRKRFAWVKYIFKFVLRD